MQVLVVEDEWLIRHGAVLNIRELQPQATVREAGSLAEAFEKLESFPKTDLVILDLKLPDSSGVTTLTKTRAFCEERKIPARIVVLSGSSERELVIEVLQGHATGFIVKARPQKEFADALSVTLNGSIYIPHPVLEFLGPSTAATTALRASTQANGYPACLTARQCEICDLLVDGLTYKEIAQVIAQRDNKPLAPNTVRVHVNNIADELGVTKNRKAGVMAALARLGIRSKRNGGAA